MPKHPLRLREGDLLTIADALDHYASECSNHICADYAESHGIEAMREWEKRKLHCLNIIQRIRKARS